MFVGEDVVGLCGSARGAQQQGGGGEEVEKASTVERHLYISTVLRYEQNEQKTDAGCRQLDDVDTTTMWWLLVVTLRCWRRRPAGQQ